MKKLIFLLSLVFALGTQLKAQTCGTCSVNITSFDTLAYTINVGQTFCVDTTGNFSGTIILNGGTVCNKGFFNPSSITFNSGTIANYGNTSVALSISIGNNKTIINNADAIFNITGGITMSGGNFTNNGITNISQNITNTSGTINNTGILNCVQLTGSNAITNTGVINSN